MGEEFVSVRLAVRDAELLRTEMVLLGAGLAIEIADLPFDAADRREQKRARLERARRVRSAVVSALYGEAKTGDES